MESQNGVRQRNSKPTFIPNEEPAEQILEPRVENLYEYIKTITIIFVLVAICGLSLLLITILVPGNSDRHERIYVAYKVLPIFISGMLVLFFLRNEPKALLPIMLLMSGGVGYAIGFSGCTIHAHTDTTAH